MEIGCTKHPVHSLAKVVFVFFTGEDTWCIKIEQELTSYSTRLL